MLFYHSCQFALEADGDTALVLPDCFVLSSSSTNWLYLIFSGKSIERDSHDWEHLCGFLHPWGSWLSPHSRAALHNEGSSSFSERELRREECYSGILPKGCSCYRLPTKSSLLPPARVPWPSTDKFMGIVSSQTSPRELHLPLCTQPRLPSSKLPVLFLNAGLHMTSLYGWPGKPQVWA